MILSVPRGFFQRISALKAPAVEFRMRIDAQVVSGCHSVENPHFWQIRPEVGTRLIFFGEPKEMKSEVIVSPRAFSRWAERSSPGCIQTGDPSLRLKNIRSAMTPGSESRYDCCSSIRIAFTRLRYIRLKDCANCEISSEPLTASSGTLRSPLLI